MRDNAVTAGTLARDLDAVYRDVGHVADSRSTSRIGFYEIWNNKLYNSAMYVTLGDGEPQIRHVHRKVFLPTYGLFDEERFVERGRESSRVRHAVGTRGDARLRGRLAQHDGDDRRARRRADHLRLRGAAGARRLAQRPTAFPGRRA